MHDSSIYSLLSLKAELERDLTPSRDSESDLELTLSLRFWVWKLSPTLTLSAPWSIEIFPRGSVCEWPELRRGESPRVEFLRPSGWSEKELRAALSVWKNICMPVTYNTICFKFSVLRFHLSRSYHINQKASQETLSQSRSKIM